MRLPRKTRLNRIRANAFNRAKNAVASLFGGERVGAFALSFA